MLQVMRIQPSNNEKQLKHGKQNINKYYVRKMKTSLYHRQCQCKCQCKRKNQTFW